MLQKSYLKYDARNVFGVITGVDSDLCFRNDGKIIFTGALESVLCWSVKTGTCRKVLSVDASIGASVTRIVPSPDNVHLAVGYSDGSVRVWSLDTWDVKSVFTGHTKPVTALCFSKDGSLLATGSQGTEVLVWDVLGQSGKARLKGHKGSVTSVCFCNDGLTLISASRDMLVLVWDLSVQKCVQTLTGHRHEVWTVVMDPTETHLITGSSDNKLRVWKRDATKQEGVFEYYGSVDRSVESRVASIGFSSGTKLVVQSISKVVEVFSVNDEATRVKKMKRRLKREKTKLASKIEKVRQTEGLPGFDVEKEVQALESQYSAQPKASDEYSPMYTFQTSHKNQRMALSAKHSHVALMTNRNEFQIFRLRSSEASEVLSLDLPGHRSDVRSLALNSTDTQLLSTSESVAKVWSVQSQTCLSTVKTSGHGICSLYLPLDKYAAVGTKEGKVDLILLSNATVVETITCHESTVWDIQPYPDKKGIVTASADKTVKFWDFAVRKISDSESHLTLTLNRTLTLTDDVLSVCFSPDGRLIAASLLDSTVKVFYVDSLRFFLSLYGHKLPVLSISISSDSTLLISGSADKSVKIWGLDFGDCHKSLFAHEDAVTRVHFLPDTHYFISTSKDGTIKYWDADRFEHVTTMRGHVSEVWCLVVSSVGDFFMTGSHDRSIRLWSQTEEILFPESEREKEMDKLFAPSLTELQSAARNDFKDLPDLQPTSEGLGGLHVDFSVGTAIQTATSARHAEQLMEAVELAYEEWVKIEDWKSACAVAETRLSEAERESKRRKNKPLLAPPETNPLLLRMSPEDYLKYHLTKIPMSELETSLILLPTDYAMRVLTFCALWLDRSNDRAELVCRVVFFLVRTHLREISASKKAMLLLHQLQTVTKKRLSELKSCVGFTYAGMQYAKRQLKVEGNTEFFEETKLLRDLKDKKKHSEKSVKTLY